jgi:hypothetical protein
VTETGFQVVSWQFYRKFLFCFSQFSKGVIWAVSPNNFAGILAVDFMGSFVGKFTGCFAGCFPLFCEHFCSWFQGAVLRAVMWLVFPGCEHFFLLVQLAVLQEISWAVLGNFPGCYMGSFPKLFCGHFSS